jgi:hypothetical protein
MAPRLQVSDRPRIRQRQEFLPALFSALLLLSCLPTSDAIHHMKRAPVHWVNRRGDAKPLKVTNNCQQTIYPGIQTQAGDAPEKNGFKLSPGQSKSQTVSADWQGRVWARTNCSFNADGTSSASGTGPACLTGDCGGTVACFGTVRASRPPFLFSLNSQSIRARSRPLLLNLPCNPRAVNHSTIFLLWMGTTFLWASYSCC